MARPVNVVLDTRTPRPRPCAALDRASDKLADTRQSVKSPLMLAYARTGCSWAIFQFRVNSRLRSITERSSGAYPPDHPLPRFSSSNQGTYAAKHGYSCQLSTAMFAKFRGRSLWRLGRRNYALGLLRPRNNVAISEGRLDQLLEAEITTMSMQEARSLSVRDMMDLGQRPETLAALLNEELPVRYARRISMLEAGEYWGVLPKRKDLVLPHLLVFKALPEWQGKDSIRQATD
eukprot:s1589_g12.t1